MIPNRREATEATAFARSALFARRDGGEPGLVIYKIYSGYWFFGRPTVEELRQDLRAVSMKCRPDWDITTPEVKAAWQQGRKELFYPYDKTYLQTFREQD